jgi:hypothetical protein
VLKTAALKVDFFSFTILGEVQMKKRRFLICMALAAVVAGSCGDGKSALAQTQGNVQPPVNNTSVQSTMVLKGKVTPAERKAAAARRAAAAGKSNQASQLAAPVGKEGQQ